MLNLEVEVTREPVIEERLMDITSGVQLKGESKKYLVMVWIITN